MFHLNGSLTAVHLVSETRRSLSSISVTFDHPLSPETNIVAYARRVFTFSPCIVRFQSSPGTTSLNVGNVENNKRTKITCKDTIGVVLFTVDINRSTSYRPSHVVYSAVYSDVSPFNHAPRQAGSRFSNFEPAKFTVSKRVATPRRARYRAMTIPGRASERKS